MRKTIAPYSVLLAVLLGIGFAMVAWKIRAEPVAAAENGGLRIVVFAEKCPLTNVVENMPNRAVWSEGGKDIEGCVQAFPQFGVAAFYFADKTIAIVPLKFFRPVSTSLPQRRRTPAPSSARRSSHSDTRTAASSFRWTTGGRFASELTRDASGSASTSTRCTDDLPAHRPAVQRSRLQARRLHRTTRRRR